MRVTWRSNRPDWCATGSASSRTPPWRVERSLDRPLTPTVSPFRFPHGTRCDMGLFDFMKDAGAKIFGKDHDGDVTKPLSQHLREHGIDRTPFDFSFGGDGTVTMRGTVKDQDTREKAGDRKSTRLNSSH